MSTGEAEAFGFKVAVNLDVVKCVNDASEGGCNTDSVGGDPKDHSHCEDCYGQVFMLENMLDGHLSVAELIDSSSTRQHIFNISQSDAIRGKRKNSNNNRGFCMPKRRTSVL